MSLSRFKFNFFSVLCLCALNFNSFVFAKESIQKAKVVTKNAKQNSTTVKVMNKGGSPMKDLLDMELMTVNNKKIKLSDFQQSKVFLIVNTASKCGYTSQYEGLEELYKKYKDKGLAVIGFPSNDFGAQEPGTNQEIQDFCRLNYGVTFPLMAKASVKGTDAQPFYKNLLTASDDKSDVGWNFEKFLIVKDGSKIERFKSNVKPKDLEKVIESKL